MKNNYISISALSKYLKYKFDQDEHLQEVYIKGEISNFKAHTRGHFYFTLKDEGSRINAVMFQRDTTIINIKAIYVMTGLLEGKLEEY